VLAADGHGDKRRRESCLHDRHPLVAGAVTGEKTSRPISFLITGEKLA
jgi:hypothetical protein